MRSALGAGRGRIVRQLLTESLVLAALGAVLGTGIGIAILQAAPTLMPPGLLPTTMPLSFDVRVAAFCAATALAVAVGFGLLPARQATGRSLVQAVGAGAQAPASRNSRVRALIATTGEGAPGRARGPAAHLRANRSESLLVGGARGASGRGAPLLSHLPFAPRWRASVPDTAVTAVRTLDDIEREATATPRFRAALVGTFTGLALIPRDGRSVRGPCLLGAAALAGIRGAMALGASTGVVLGLVARSAVAIVGTGAAIGLVAAAALAQTISTFLFGVEPFDPLTYFAAVAVVLVTAAIATSAPAIRAARVDPAVTFRSD